MTQVPSTPPQPAQTPPPGAPPPPMEIEQNPDARTMGMLCHLLGIFTGFIGPLVIWLIKKDQMPFVDDQGKEALNWQITRCLATIPIVIPCIGALIVLGVTVVAFIFGIMGTMKANTGVRYRYPFALRLIK